MAIFRLTQVIKRPIEEVFNTVIHVENFSKWNPTNRDTHQLSEGEIGEGSQFEMTISGFGKVLQTLEEFKRNKQVMVVPHIKAFGGGHRFIFSEVNKRETRIDHEMIMIPKGIFKLMLPIMMMVGRKNVRGLAEALRKYLEEGNA